jgi:hypothetical protein
MRLFDGGLIIEQIVYYTGSTKFSTPSEPRRGTYESGSSKLKILLMHARRDVHQVCTIEWKCDVLPGQ